MPGKNGGARPGAGRPRKADRYSGQLARFEDRCAGRLDANLDNIEAIADGSSPVVVETWEAAGLAVVETHWLNEDGTPREDDKGRPIKIRKLAFPDLPKDEVILIKRIVTNQGPNLQANVWQAERTAGKTPQGVELTGEDGGPIPVDLMAAIEKLYPGEPET